jgi:hypothetical protein
VISLYSVKSLCTPLNPRASGSIKPFEAPVAVFAGECVKDVFGRQRPLGVTALEDLILSCCLSVGIDFGRAYFRVRWFLPWLSPRTSIRLPWLRFPKPPYDPGQPVFPGPVQTLAFLRRSSRCQRDL